MLALLVVAYAGMVYFGDSAIGRMFVALTGWSGTGAALGFAARFKPVATPVLSYLAEATMPVFIVHHVPVLLLGLLLLPMALPVWFKIVSIWLLATAVSLAAYHWLIRPWPLMRWAMGIGRETSSAARSWCEPEAYRDVQRARRGALISPDRPSAQINRIASSPDGKRIDVRGARARQAIGAGERRQSRRCPVAAQPSQLLRERVHRGRPQRRIGGEHARDQRSSSRGTSPRTSTAASAADCRLLVEDLHEVGALVAAASRRASRTGSRRPRRCPRA